MIYPGAFKLFLFIFFSMKSRDSRQYLYVLVRVFLKKKQPSFPKFSIFAFPVPAIFWDGRSQALAISHQSPPVREQLVPGAAGAEPCGDHSGGRLTMVISVISMEFHGLSGGIRKGFNGLNREIFRFHLPDFHGQVLSIWGWSQYWTIHQRKNSCTCHHPSQKLVPQVS